MTNQEIIDVVKAASEGKLIEYRVVAGPMWGGEDSKWILNPNPGWNFEECEYRVRREPRTIYVNEYGSRPKLGYKKNAAVYDTRENADRGAVGGRIRCTKWVEVIE